MKAKYFLITPILISALLMLLISNASGPAANGNGNRTGSPTSNGTCSNCHSGGSFGTTVTASVTDLLGTPVTSYIPGDSLYIEIQVGSTSGTPKYGFQCVMLTSTNANAGNMDLAISASTHITTVSGKKLAEQSSKSSTGTFKVRWIAPAAGTGTVTLYYIGNAVNSSFNTSGDQATAGQSLTLTEQPVFTLSLTQGNTINCFGDSTASITGTVVNGVAPYTYIINGGTPIGPIPLSTVTNNNVPAGTYYVSASDANGNTSMDSIVILQPNAIAITQSHTDESCYQANDGTALITVNGGTAPYIYNWSNGSILPSINSLAPGDYYVTVTDVNGCMLIDTVNIDSASQIVITKTMINPTCYTSLNGEVSTSVSGGIPPYSYAWNNGEITANISGLDTGFYKVTITDSFGCTNEDSLVLTSNNTIPEVGLGPDTIICDTSVGVFSINAGSLINDYDYLWNTGDTSYSLTIFFTGDYSLQVTDNLGCVGSDSITIGETPCATSIEDLFSMNQVSLYPNPATDFLFVESEVEGDLIIYDVFGKEIMTTALEIGKSQISMSNIPNGAYFVVIKSKDAVGVQKILVL